jgi:hypothetical protein
MLNGCAAMTSGTSPPPSAERLADTPPAGSSPTQQTSSLIADNVDRIESEWLEGEDFVAFWEREGYRYVITATRIVQKAKVWPDDF